MNSVEDAARVVTAKLPSRIPVRVEVTGPDSGDGMTSVGLGELNLNTALDAIGEIGSTVIDKIKVAKPSRATCPARTSAPAGTRQQPAPRSSPRRAPSSTGPPTASAPETPATAHPHPRDQQQDATELHPGGPVAKQARRK
jgi:hypothetical protein